jgi:hypothetical protein
VPGSDPAVDALSALVRTLEANVERCRHAIERAHAIARLREQGYSWREILSTEERPLIIDMVGQNVALLTEVGGRFRREEARCLRDEGAKPEEIADLFGITVDHVEAMLEGRE